jgi:NADH:ubiquinone oxidoreductase subunit 2 (subunit N)
MALEGILMMLAFAGKALALFVGWAAIALAVYTLYALCRFKYEMNEPAMSAHLR